MYSLGKKQKTHTKLTIGILILMIITMIGLSSMMIQQSKSLIMNETQRYLSELSKQTSSRVDQNIAKNIAQLREVSANLSEIATTDAVGQTIIDSVLKENDFSWIGYVDMNGLLHVKNHKTVSVTKLEIVLDALHKQKSGVSKQLETLYEQFNLKKPVDFHSPSLSVSDIVAIKQDGKVSCHYCNSVGFTEIPGFLPDNPLKNAEMMLEDDYGMIDGIINNGPKEPTVAQLEQQARSGQPISLMDLAEAVHREERDKKKSVMEQLKSQPRTEHKKTAPKKSAEREL